MTSTAQTGFESQGAPAARRCGFTRWSAWELGATVAGFVVFWPLGLLAMFLKWKNGEMWKGSAEHTAPWAGFKAPDMSGWGWKGGSSTSYGFAGSGNAAFDAYKREQLKRLDEERRKLEEDQKAFRDFVEKVRRAKDQDEFDRFMADRNMPQSS